MLRTLAASLPMPTNMVPISRPMQQWMNSRIIVSDRSRHMFKKVRRMSSDNWQQNDVAYVSPLRQICPLLVSMGGGSVLLVTMSSVWPG